MKSFSQPKKKVGKHVGQRSLTSFYFKKKESPQQTSESQSKKENEGDASKLSPQPPQLAQTPAKELPTEVIEIDDSPKQAREIEGREHSRPHKRAKVEVSTVIPLAIDTKDPTPEEQATETALQTKSLSHNSHIHQRFQDKLMNGVSRRQAKQLDGSTKQKHTPLELQVVELKKKHPGVILIIEVGYKFRFFGEDAELASTLCNIFCYPDRNFMTASIPVPRLHVYVRRLVAAGHKVGVVRQMETAALKAVGDNKYAPFTRKLTALYTKSTLEAGDKADIGEAFAGDEAAGSLSNSELSNYLLCLVESAGPSDIDSVEIGLVAVEISAGTVLYGQFKDGMMRGALEAHLLYANPSELLVAQPVSNPTRRLLGSFSQAVKGLKAESVPGKPLLLVEALGCVRTFYSSGGGEAKPALESVEKLPELVLIALAHSLNYLKQFNLEAVLQQSCVFQAFSQANEISLSPNALRQLEVLRNSDDGGERGSLVWLLNHTRSVMGGRLMRAWVGHPLRSLPAIRARLQAVQELTAGEGDESSLVQRLRSCLAGMPDLERGITRILHRTASPSEVLTTLQAFSRMASDLRIQAAEEGATSGIPGIKAELLQRLLAAAAAPEARDQAATMLALIDAQAAEANDRVALFAKSEEEFPAVAERRQEVAACDRELSDLLPTMAKRLKVGRLEYKSVLNQGDFLIEVDATRKDVPKDWEKISSTKRFNRFRPPEVTEALKRLEVAREKLQEAAAVAYHEFLGRFVPLYTPFRASASALASLDCLQSLSLVATNAGYVCPEFVGPDEPAQLQIVGGRHPVLDALMDTPFVPNDTALGSRPLVDGKLLALVQLVTGPNMGGKSSYIRQVALIAIMAQIGSFVPAEWVRLRAIDAIHTRMGASDNLAQGRSTFLEELSETSSILATATESSLVVIDELGRGTSTHDGLAIAQATLQYLVERTKSLTLFVTHYPTVATLQEQFPGLVEARYMSYIQDVPANDPAFSSITLPLDQRSSTASGGGPRGLPKITFLFKLVPGVADRSFGLNVARMAHLPEQVIQRAATQAMRMEEQILAAKSCASVTDSEIHPTMKQFFSKELPHRLTEGLASLKALQEKAQALRPQV